MATSDHRILWIIQILAFASILLLSAPSRTAHSGQIAPAIDPALVWKQNSRKQEQLAEAVYHQKTNQRILSVIAEYKTGLKENDQHRIAQAILKQSQVYGYDPLFLTALIITESSFFNWSKSSIGALGLMQIRPRTGKALAAEISIPWKGEDTLFDPAKNIALGSYYLNKLINRFGNLDTALEAYNHGPTRMSRFLRRGKQPIKYSSKVFTIYNDIRFAKPGENPELVNYSPENPHVSGKLASGPLLSTENSISTFAGDTLWRLTHRLGFGSDEATLVAAALWIDNQDAFINGNLHGIKAGKNINLDNLEYRLATMNRDTARQIVQNQWRKWTQGENGGGQVSVAQAKFTR